MNATTSADVCNGKCHPFYSTSIYLSLWKQQMDLLPVDIVIDFAHKSGKPILSPTNYIRLMCLLAPICIWGKHLLSACYLVDTPWGPSNFSGLIDDSFIHSSPAQTHILSPRRGAVWEPGQAQWKKRAGLGRFCDLPGDEVSARTFYLAGWQRSVVPNRHYNYLQLIQSVATTHSFSKSSQWRENQVKVCKNEAVIQKSWLTLQMSTLLLWGEKH